MRIRNTTPLARRSGFIGVLLVWRTKERGRGIVEICGSFLGKGIMLGELVHTLVGGSGEVRAHPLELDDDPDPTQPDLTLSLPLLERRVDRSWMSL